MDPPPARRDREDYKESKLRRTSAAAHQTVRREFAFNTSLVNEPPPTQHRSTSATPTESRGKTNRFQFSIANYFSQPLVQPPPAPVSFEAPPSQSTNYPKLVPQKLSSQARPSSVPQVDLVSSPSPARKQAKPKAKPKARPAKKAAAEGSEPGARAPVDVSTPLSNPFSPAVPPQKKSRFNFASAPTQAQPSQPYPAQPSPSPAPASPPGPALSPAAPSRPSSPPSSVLEASGASSDLEPIAAKLQRVRQGPSQPPSKRAKAGTATASKKERKREVREVREVAADLIDVPAKRQKEAKEEEPRRRRTKKETQLSHALGVIFDVLDTAREQERAPELRQLKKAIARQAGHYLDLEASYVGGAGRLAGLRAEVRALLEQEAAARREAAEIGRQIAAEDRAASAEARDAGLMAWAGQLTALMQNEPGAPGGGLEASAANGGAALASLESAAGALAVLQAANTRLRAVRDRFSQP